MFLAGLTRRRDARLCHAKERGAYSSFSTNPPGARMLNNRRHPSGEKKMNSLGGGSVCEHLAPRYSSDSSLVEVRPMTSVSVLLVKERLHSAHYKLKMQIARGYINLEETDQTAKTDGFGGFKTVPPDCVCSGLSLVSELSRKASVRAVLGIYLWYIRIFISLQEYSEFNRRMITWHQDHRIEGM
jgi:hypothetical protein